MAHVQSVRIEPNVDALARVPASTAVHYGVVPLRLDGEVLVVAMEDPMALDVLDELRLAVGCEVLGERAPAELIAKAIREHYGIGAETLERLIDTRELSVVADVVDASIDDEATDASVMRFVNQLIVDAHNSRATDIHLEPFQHRLRVRYRVDGVLLDAKIPESIRHFREAIVTRFKIMASMDIAERRLPQDGRIQVRIAGQELDLRVSVIPIAHGESVNLRILQRSNVLMGLDAIGFEEKDLENLDTILRKPHGIVLLTGPTGSGKTTTLYAFLGRLNETARKILTIEDPVEYQIDGICQMSVRPDIGFTFATGLRSMLRHDPDVMLVGEIRDFETAELAIRCSLTGHLVFSTLHTNDAAGAAARLIDIGIEPYLLASSVEAVLAQRLVRRICPECERPYTPDPPTLKQLSGILSEEEMARLRMGGGCERCRETGYRGRTAIYEILLFNEAIRTMVMDRAPGATIQRAAVASGMTTLRRCGLTRALAGITSAEEVLRVTQDEQGT